jgi:hypothetical protein
MLESSCVLVDEACPPNDYEAVDILKSGTDGRDSPGSFTGSPSAKPQHRASMVTHALTVTAWNQAFFS